MKLRSRKRKPPTRNRRRKRKRRARAQQLPQAAAQAAAATVQQDDSQPQEHRHYLAGQRHGVARDVSIGQTVAASLQTPTLFLIAQDLSNGSRHQRRRTRHRRRESGRQVNFTVLAYPNQIFNGTVTQVRINPTTVNNVVTYDVVVDVNNSSGKLLPGMTANATINVASAPNALVVPLSRGARNGCEKCNR